MNEFSVGDYVVPRSPLYGIHSVGRVTRTYKVGDHPAVEVRWESGNHESWYEMGLQLAMTPHEEYQLAVQYLGEDYFA